MISVGLWGHKVQSTSPRGESYWDTGAFVPSTRDRRPRG